MVGLLWVTLSSWAAEVPDPPKNDVLTVASISSVTYFTAALLHEGLGHQGGCLIGGGQAIGFSTSIAGCEGTSAAGHRWDTAGGAGANVLAGAAFTAPLLWAPPKNGADYYFWWLSSTVNFLEGAGYLLVGPWVPVGDWGTDGFLRDIENPLPWQIGLSAAGAAMTFGTVGLSNRLLEPMLGSDDATRGKRRALLCLLPYFAGSTLVTGSALLNRVGPQYAVTAAIANFTGTLFLAYIPLFFKDDLFRFGPKTTENALVVQRSPGWIAAGIASLVVGVGVFGPGIGAFPNPHPLDPTR